jgi:hypothetical protein
MTAMNKAIALASLVLILAAAGCAPARKAPGEKTLVKCTTCGAEFTVEEGMKAYEAAHSK